MIPIAQKPDWANWLIDFATLFSMKIKSEADKDYIQDNSATILLGKNLPGINGSMNGVIEFQTHHKFSMCSKKAFKEDDAWI